MKPWALPLTVALDDHVERLLGVLLNRAQQLRRDVRLEIAELLSVRRRRSDACRSRPTPPVRRHSERRRQPRRHDGRRDPKAHSNATRHASLVPKERSSDLRWYSLGYAASTLPLSLMSASQAAHGPQIHVQASVNRRCDSGWPSSPGRVRTGRRHEFTRSRDRRCRIPSGRASRSRSPRSPRRAVSPALSRLARTPAAA